MQGLEDQHAIILPTPEAEINISQKLETSFSKLVSERGSAAEEGQERGH